MVKNLTKTQTIALNKNNQTKVIIFILGPWYAYSHVHRL